MAGDSLSLIRLLAFVGMVALQPSILAQNGPRELSRKLYGKRGQTLIGARVSGVDLVVAEMNKSCADLRDELWNDAS